YLRVFSFMGQVLAMVKESPILLAPLAINLAVATVINILFAIGYGILGSESALGILFLPLGLIALYFIDYFSAGIRGPRPTPPPALPARIVPRSGSAGRAARSSSQQPPQSRGQ